MRIFTRTYVFQCFFAFLTPGWGPRSPQDRSKTGPRAIKSDAFFVLIFDSFWCRFGVVLGGILSSKIDSRPCRPLTRSDLVFDLVIRWSQDSSKTVPRGLLGGSWVVLVGSWGRLGGVLGRSWGLLGPFLDGLGGLVSHLEGLWGCSLGLLGLSCSTDAICRFDSLIRFFL